MSDWYEAKYGDFGGKLSASSVRNYDKFDYSKVKIICKGLGDSSSWTVIIF